MANPQITSVSLLYISNISDYCYHLVKVISLVLAQSEHNKRGLLYQKLKTTKDFKENDTLLSQEHL
jgi:hypothetical protein